jgi:peptidyl-tRNA hydrolase
MQNQKLYVLVRRDLSKSQQAVQACHAVAQFSLFDEQYSDSSYPWENRWDNGTIVLLTVRNLEELIKWDNQLLGAHTFEEPDIGYETTALAISGDSALGDLFKDLRLL